MRHPVDYYAAFLGPRSENADWIRTLISEVTEDWFSWRKSLFASDPSPFDSATRCNPNFVELQGRIEHHLKQMVQLYRNEVPTYSPRYIGQMVSDNAIPAMLGHLVALIHNPNNTSTEVAPVSTRMEQEAIEMLCQLIGYSPITARGHFTSGGTVANLEGLWRARYRYEQSVGLSYFLKKYACSQITPARSAHLGWPQIIALMQKHSLTPESLADYYTSCSKSDSTHSPIVLVPKSRHFSWDKCINLLGLNRTALWEVNLDSTGAMCVSDLRAKISRALSESHPILAIVSIAGTTETGRIDPIDRICEAIAEANEHFDVDLWHHVDAAYGGFFCCLEHSSIASPIEPDTLIPLRSLRLAHSVTLDPHKLGYVPYSCGTLITRSDYEYRTPSFSAPYLEQEDQPSDTWATTVEGSRAGYRAASVWLTGKSIGFTSTHFSNLVHSTILSCRRFKESLSRDVTEFRALEPTTTNILCFSLAKNEEPLSRTNERTRFVYDSISKGPKFAISKTILQSTKSHPQIAAHLALYDGLSNSDELFLIRCVFMNPFLSDVAVADTLVIDFAKAIRESIDLFEKMSVLQSKGFCCGRQ